MIVSAHHNLSHLSWRELGEVFDACPAPQTPLDGRFRGQFLIFRLGPGLTQAAAGLASVWMPWRGKDFLPDGQPGYNLLRRSDLPAARLVWPCYRHYQDAGPGLLHTFPFRVGPAAGHRAPHAPVLRLDYDLAVNPRWNMRRVVDELVCLEPGTLLGRAYIRWLFGQWYIWAYFLLEKESDEI